MSGVWVSVHHYRWYEEERAVVCGSERRSGTPLLPNLIVLIMSVEALAASGVGQITGRPRHSALRGAVCFPRLKRY
jgi:hypothetical protein